MEMGSSWGPHNRGDAGAFWKGMQAQQADTTNTTDMFIPYQDGAIPNPYYGMPKYPGFNSLLDENGNLHENFKVDAGKHVDPAMTAELKRRAMGGDSVWARMAMQKQGAEESRAVQNAGAQASGNAAQARAGLGMRGGLSSGARERVATQGMRDRMLATQDARNSGAMARADIGMKEADRGDDAYKMHNAAAQLMIQNDQFNTANQYNEKRAGDVARLEEYKTRAQMWGADKQAKATEDSGKK